MQSIPGKFGKQIWNQYMQSSLTLIHFHYIVLQCFLHLSALCCWFKGKNISGLYRLIRCCINFQKFIFVDGLDLEWFWRKVEQNLRIYVHVQVDKWLLHVFHALTKSLKSLFIFRLFYSSASVSWFELVPGRRRVGCGLPSMVVKFVSKSTKIRAGNCDFATLGG